jgi:SAM-dependent methyltransferase
MSASMAAATAASNASALQIALSHLQGALTYTESTNVQTNRKLWNEYAKNYSDRRTSSKQQRSARSSNADESSSTAASAPSTATPAAADAAASSTTTAPADWVKQMASAVRAPSELEFLGDEWADESSLKQALEEFLLPYIGVNRLPPEIWKESEAVEKQCASTGGISYLPPSRLGFPGSDLVVAEIGVGGGRIAARVYENVGHLYAMDIAEEMIRQAKESLQAVHAKRQKSTPQAAKASPVFVDESAGFAATTTSVANAAASSTAAPASSTAGSSSADAALPPNLSFHLLSSAPALPPKLAGQCDFVYCFDVFPHVDLHTISAYFASIKTILKPNPPASDLYGPPRPRVLLHVANLLAPLGWERFRKQTKCTAGGFYFHSPEMIHKLAKEHGYRIIQQSRWEPEVDPATKANAAPGAAEKDTDPWKEARETRRKNIYYQRDLLFVMEVI